MSFAHGQGILHRDLKPSNVIIDRNDRPRVTDFGLAKRLHDRSEVTLAGQMLGSPNYAPPEQAKGNQSEVGVRSDVYSLGGLLYYLITARPPFLAPTIHETLRLVFETEPVSPRVLNPSLPRDLETICLKCLEKDPARRYATAQELAEELGRFERHEPILARPISAPEQAWRWCAHHPAIAGLAAIVVFSLVTTSVVFYTSAQRIERARSQELAARITAEEELYATSMLASSLGTLGTMDPRDLRLRLEASRPKPGGSDQRGFEWRYYWSESQGDEIAALPGHTHVVDAAFYSPDGNAIATHSLDGKLKVWDAKTLGEIATVEQVFNAGGFVAGGTRLVFSRADQSIGLLDLATGATKPIRPPGGQLIAALPDGNSLVLFDARGRPTLRAVDRPVVSGEGGAVTADVCAAVSADGRFAAVAGPGYPGILVLDLPTGRQLAELIDERPVIALSFSADGQRLVSSGFDGVLKIWDVARGRQEHSFQAFIDPVWGLAFSADCRFFAAGGNNREIKLWNTSTWEQAPIEKLRGHLSTIRCVAFSPDGSRLVSGSENEQALLWPTRTNRLPREVVRLLRGPQWIDRTPSIAFSPDSRLFVGTAADGTVKAWRTDTVAPVFSAAMNARTVAFSADGKFILGEGFDGFVQRWSMESAEPLATINPRTTFANWQVDPLSSQERVSLVANQAETRAQCRLCEIPSARDGINGGAMMTTPTIVMSADARTMFVGSPEGMVEVWDVPSQKRRFTFPAHKLGITALAVSDDGRFLATGSLDNSTKLWEAATGRWVTTYYAHDRPVWALAFSPDGKTLASGSCDKGIILCSTTILRHVATLLIYKGTPGGYEQEVRLLRFSPDGNLLAAALGDGTLRFFRAAPFSETDAADSRAFAGR